MSIYCYDTEFLDDGSTIELISIGIVCDDGREYYAVNSDMDTQRIGKHQWLMDNVWPHLPLRGRRESTGYVGSFSPGRLDTSSVLVKPKWVIANEVREFIVGDIARRDDAVPEEELPELWAYYGAYDHVALCQLWGPMVSYPRFMPMITHELMQEIQRVGLTDRDMPCTTAAHDALADARWNLAVARQLGLCGAKS